jgi:hypothetical protein
MDNLLACIARTQTGDAAAPDTPNLNQLRTFINRFNDDPNAETSFISRPSSNDLCQWTKKVCEYLPNSADAATANADGMRPMKQHFSAIKQFYDTVQQAGWTQIPPTVQTFMSGIQIYEAVSGLACVVFVDHPQILKAIENQLDEAREAIVQNGSMGILSLFCCGTGALMARVSQRSTSSFIRCYELYETNVRQVVCSSSISFFVLSTRNSANSVLAVFLIFSEI